MPFSVSGQVDGLDKAINDIRACSKRVRKAGVRTAVTKGTRLLGKAVKQNIPKWVKKRGGRFSKLSSYAGKQLAKSIGTKIKTYPSGPVVGVVGARKNFREAVAIQTRNSPRGARYPKKAGDPRFIDPVKYLHLIELGTAHSAARHAMRDAMAATAPAVSQVMIQEIEKAVAKDGAR